VQILVQVWRLVPAGGTINLYDDEGNPIDYRIELESGEGFAFGADLQINTGELKFTIGEPCELLDLLFFDLKRSV
jgi:hypothetical protein